VRRRIGSALTGLVLLAGVAGEARAAGTAEITGGFTRVEADASINCPPQGSAGDGEANEQQAGPADFEAEVTASATSEDLSEDCGVRSSAGARQRTLVSDAGDGLVVSSSGSAVGTGTGEPTSDGDFAVERFNGRTRISIGFTVTGGPVEFSMTGSHSGLQQPGAFSEGIVAGPREQDRSGLPQGFAVTGILPPGDYSVSAGAQCVHVPAAANGTSACPQARYSFTLVVGEEAADADGDALPDVWEEEGVDTDGDGSVDLDLPAMGADPLHKDLFLEIDHMQGHALLQSAVDVVTQSFADAPVANPDGTTGIALHVDNGPASTMNPRTGATWAGRSDRDELPHVEVLGEHVGGEYDWTEFDVLKETGFAAEREPVFHYAISGHGYGSPTETSSGISRGIEGSDLLVTLGVGCAGTGADCTHTQPEQAGTLMHELGHNLGLRHGGGDGMNYKPNYLSIMNYAFQFVGLRSRTEPPRFDYSRFSIPLDERALNENAGFGVAASSPAAHLITFGFCPGPSRAVQPERSVDVAWNVLFSSDFDCDTSFTSPVASDVNADGATTALAPFEDWTNLVYDGGLVGLGDSALPDRTELIEPQVSELLAARDAIEALSAPAATPTATPGPGATSPPTPQGGSGLRPPPALAGLALRPARFAASRRGRGTRVSFRLSEAGRVRFRVERELPGRRRGGRCVAPRRAPRGRACTRRARVRGSFEHDGRAGANTLRFRGRVAGRALRPGRYVLVATPLAADGRPGRATRVRFRIAR
jgi:hypothetical protein